MGGADTELDHQIHVWQRLGIEVHCCHTGDLDGNLRSMRLEDRGVVYHAPRDWSSLQGLDVISFCNGRFLEALPEIRRHARTVTWVNCMTWAFPKEIEAQRQGLIDFHLYQTPHAQQRVGAQLVDLGRPFRSLRFHPYFHAADFPFVSPDARKRDKFRFGRISRPDADKFGKRQLWIYETMTAPVLKEGLILGWAANARQKFGQDPQSWIKALPAGGTSQQEFYRHCDAVIMTTDTFENLPRVGFEAMASGSVLVVDRKGGWTTQVEDGRTGWFCRDDREFVYKASRCAFEHAERAEMARAAERLQQHWGMDAAESRRRVLEVIERGPGSFRIRDRSFANWGKGRERNSSASTWSCGCPRARRATTSR